MNVCYVHIPFCDSICYYCDFCRFKVSKQVQEDYIDTLIQEIKETQLPQLDTLYFGGGTPSILTCTQFERLAQEFTLAESVEWTVEANPDSLTKEKIELYKKCGVNRISLGVQSFNDDLLTRIGRTHSSQQVFTCIQECKAIGIENLSIDLIFGLPNQSLEDVQKDVEQFLDLDINHLSIYSLQIEEDSIFGKQGLQPIDPQLEEEMYDWICQRLKEAGYIHYEISSFAKAGKESKHNQAYWSDMDFYGLGCGASGRVNTNRYDNCKNIYQYIEAGPQRTWIQESHDDKAFNAIMMGLRTNRGVDITHWNDVYQQDLESKYRDVIQKYDGLQIIDKHLVCDEQARKILNTILVDFLSAD